MRQGVNGWSCNLLRHTPDVTEQQMDCQAACDANLPACVGYSWEPARELCGIKGNAANLHMDPSWGCREVYGQSDIIAYGSHAVGGLSPRTAEVICVTRDDHTPGEEVLFDPLGKGADGSFTYQGTGRQPASSGGRADAGPNSGVDCSITGLAQVTTAHCPVAAAAGGGRGAGGQSLVPSSCPADCATNFNAWNAACQSSATFRQADAMLNGQLVAFASKCVLAPDSGGGH